jgi:hypothetical protein
MKCAFAFPFRRRQTAIMTSSRLQTRLLRSVCLLIWLTCLSLAQPFAAAAQTDVPAPLPPAAQEAFDKGIMAAREQGYLVAIRYLQEARKLAPHAPQIFRSLGAVEAKIPGRELRAIAWYGAYLAALPNASDAAEVKNEIVRLNIRNEIVLSGLIKSVQDAASQVSDNMRENSLSQVPVLWAKAGDISAALKTVDFLDSDVYKGSALKEISEVQASAGDFEGAQKTADLIQREDYKSNAQSAIADAQIKSGDFTGAQKTLAAVLKTAVAIESDREKGFALWNIAEAQLKAGDIPGAQKTADLIQYEYYKLLPQASIAKAQAANGDMVGAKATLAAAQRTADLTKDGSAKSTGLAAIAEAQTASGDIANARETLVAALKTVDLIDGIVAELLKARAWSYIASVQARSGDIAGAKRTADRISSDYSSQSLNPALAVIAEAQAKAGDVKGALKTANRIKDAFAKGYAQQLIAGVQAKDSKVKDISSNPQVSAWLNKLDDSNPFNDCPLNTAPFLDLAAHLKSLPSVDKDWEVFGQVNQTARSIAWAQFTLDQMLKQQAKR